jgi:hypothetical protein
MRALRVAFIVRSSTCDKFVQVTVSVLSRLLQIFWERVMKYYWDWQSELS